MGGFPIDCFSVLVHEAGAVDEAVDQTWISGPQQTLWRINQDPVCIGRGPISC